MQKTNGLIKLKFEKSGICRSTFERWSNEESLPVIRIGKNKRYVLKEELEKWFELKNKQTI